MNQNRGPACQERDDVYQNQNSMDLFRNRGRYRNHHEPEENIYERLDNDEENDDVEVVRHDNLERVQNAIDNHTYERIDNRSWHRGEIHPRGNFNFPQNLPGPSVINDLESRNLQYDQPRNFYTEASRNMRSQFCPYRVGRLGRNCFSSENITYASYRRYFYQSGRNCSCQFCRHLCHQCFNIHDRLRYQDGNVSSYSNSRHYIYQVSRNCRCHFCRSESPYVRLPMSSGRFAELSRRECQCRDPSNCNCAGYGRLFSSANSAIYVGRMGFDQIVNNPLYASPAMYVGRMERPCAENLAAVTASSNSSSNDFGANAIAGPSNESGTSRSTSKSGASGSQVSCQHTCDDSCIRNPGGNVSTGVCQFMGRCERGDCQHGGRVSVHWWFVNKWLPSWGSQNLDKNSDKNGDKSSDRTNERENPRGDGELREQPQDSDSEEPERA